MRAKRTQMRAIANPNASDSELKCERSEQNQQSERSEQEIVKVLREGQAAALLPFAVGCGGHVPADAC